MLHPYQTISGSRRTCHPRVFTYRHCLLGLAHNFLLHNRAVLCISAAICKWIRCCISAAVISMAQCRISRCSALPAHVLESYICKDLTLLWNETGRVILNKIMIRGSMLESAHDDNHAYYFSPSWIKMKEIGCLRLQMFSQWTTLVDTLGNAEVSISHESTFNLRHEGSFWIILILLKHSILL